MLITNNAKSNNGLYLLSDAILVVDYNYFTNIYLVGIDSIDALNRYFKVFGKSSNKLIKCFECDGYTLYRADLVPRNFRDELAERQYYRLINTDRREHKNLFLLVHGTDLKIVKCDYHNINTWKFFVELGKEYGFSYKNLRSILVNDLEYGYSLANAVITDDSTLYVCNFGGIGDVLKNLDKKIDTTHRLTGKPCLVEMTDTLKFKQTIKGLVNKYNLRLNWHSVVRDKFTILESMKTGNKYLAFHEYNTNLSHLSNQTLNLIDITKERIEI